MVTDITHNTEKVNELYEWRQAEEGRGRVTEKKLIVNRRQKKESSWKSEVTSTLCWGTCVSVEMGKNTKKKE